MKPIAMQNVTVEGDLRGRILKNFSRLHDPIYRAGRAGLPPYCCVGWPGDWEGRAMLALIHGEESLHTKAAYLEELIQWIYRLMNDEGYRSEEGDKLNLEDINEQMHSAQNWLMRAFMAYYRLTGERRYLEDVKRILRALYLPITPHLCHYPRTAEDRAVASDKAVIGHSSLQQHSARIGHSLRNGGDQAGFACAVGPGQHEPLSLAEGEGKPVHHGMIAIAYRYVFCTEHFLHLPFLLR